jgi:hypothetical protein
VSAAAKKYLETTHGPPSVFTPADLKSGTEMSWLRHAYDRPGDEAVAGWVQPEPKLSIAVDPARPGVAWPVGFIEDQSRRKPDWIVGVLGFLFGTIAWFIGWQLVLGERSPVLVAVFAIGLLLGLPWWGEALPRMIRSMNADFGEVIADMLGDVDALDRLVASAPEDATLAQGERIAWRAGDDVYADTFGKIAFKLPNPRPANPDAALNALADEVAANMRALDESDRSKIFERLEQNKIGGRSQAGFVFLRAAREAFVDAHAAPAVRDHARRFLEAWVTQPVEEPYPGDLGFETRIRLLRELTTIPQPNSIAIPASWIVERAEGRRSKSP